MQCGGEEHQIETLLCDDACLMEQRNRALAQALDVDSVPLSQRRVPYPTWLLEYAIWDSGFVDRAERILADFITSEEQTAYLPPMGYEKRQVLLELARVYRVETDALSNFNKRFIRLTRSLQQSVPLDAVLLSNIAVLFKQDPDTIQGRVLDIEETLDQECILHVSPVDATVTISHLRRILQDFESQFALDLVKFDVPEAAIAFDSKTIAQQAVVAFERSHQFYTSIGHPVNPSGDDASTEPTQTEKEPDADGWIHV